MTTFQQFSAVWELFCNYLHYAATYWSQDSSSQKHTSGGKSGTSVDLSSLQVEKGLILFPKPQPAHKLYIMKRKHLLKTALFSLIAFGGLYSFLYLNTTARVQESDVLHFGENQIMEQIDELEEKKILPEALLLEKLIEIGKNLIP